MPEDPVKIDSRERAGPVSLWLERQRQAVTFLVVCFLLYTLYVLLIADQVDVWTEPYLRREIGRHATGIFSEDLRFTYDRVRLKRAGAGLTIHGLKIGPKDSLASPVTVEKVDISVRPFPWAVSSIRLDKPRVQMVIDEQGRINLADLLADREEEAEGGVLPRLIVKDGYLECIRYAPGGSRSTWRLHEMDLTLHPGDGSRMIFRGRSRLGRNKNPIRISGYARPAQGELFINDLSANDFNLTSLNRLMPESLRGMQGRIGVSGIRGLIDFIDPDRSALVSGKISFDSVAVPVPGASERLALTGGTLNFSANRAWLDQLALQFGTSRMLADLSCSIIPVPNDEPPAQPAPGELRLPGFIRDVAGDIDVQRLEFTDLDKMLPGIFEDFGGGLSGTIKIGQQGQFVGLEYAINSADLKYGELTASRSLLTGSLLDGRLQVDELFFDLDGGELSGEGTFDLKRGSFAYTLGGKNLYLGGIDQLPQSLGLPRGFSGSGDLHFNQAMEAGRPAEGELYFNLREPTLAGHWLDSATGRLLFAENRLWLDRCSIGVGGGQAFAEGYWGDVHDFDLGLILYDIDLSALPVDTPRGVAGTLAGQLRLSRSGADSPEGLIDLSLFGPSFDGKSLDRIELKGAYADNSLEASRVALLKDDYRVVLGGGLDFSSGRTDLDGTVEGLNLAGLREAFYSDGPWLSGVVDAELGLSGSPEALQVSLRQKTSRALEFNAQPFELEIEGACTDLSLPVTLGLTTDGFPLVAMKPETPASYQTLTLGLKADLKERSRIALDLLSTFREWGYMDEFERQLDQLFPPGLVEVSDAGLVTGEGSIELTLNSKKHNGSYDFSAGIRSDEFTYGGLVLKDFRLDVTRQEEDLIGVDFSGRGKLSEFTGKGGVRLAEGQVPLVSLDLNFRVNDLMEPVSLALPQYKEQFGGALEFGGRLLGPLNNPSLKEAYLRNLSDLRLFDVTLSKVDIALDYGAVPNEIRIDRCDISGSEGFSVSLVEGVQADGAAPGVIYLHPEMQGDSFLNVEMTGLNLALVRKVLQIPEDIRGVMDLSARIDNRDGKPGVQIESAVRSPLKDEGEQGVRLYNLMFDELTLDAFWQTDEWKLDIASLGVKRGDDHVEVAGGVWVEPSWFGPPEMGKVDLKVSILDPHPDGTRSIGLGFWEELSGGSIVVDGELVQPAGSDYLVKVSSRREPVRNERGLMEEVWLQDVRGDMLIDVWNVSLLDNDMAGSLYVPMRIRDGVAHFEPMTGDAAYLIVGGVRAELDGRMDILALHPALRQKFRSATSGDEAIDIHVRQIGDEDWQLEYGGFIKGTYRLLDVPERREGRSLWVHGDFSRLNMLGSFSVRDGLITIRENVGLVSRPAGENFLRLYLDLRLGILDGMRMVDENRILNVLLEPTNLYLTGEINRLALQGVIRSREGTMTLFNGAQFTIDEGTITFRPDLQSDPGQSGAPAGYQIDPLVGATAYSRFRNTNPNTTTANEFIDVTVSVRAKLSGLKEGKGVTFSSNAGLSEQELLESMVYASSAQSLLGGFFRKILLGEDYQSSLVVGTSSRDKTYVDVEKRLFERLSLIYKGELFTNFPEYDVGIMYHIRPNSFLEIVQDEQEEQSALLKYRWRF